MHTDLLASGLEVDVRAAGPSDAIDGTLPSFVVSPLTPEAAAGTLGWASRQRLSLVVRGAGTKLGWGRPPQRFDGILDMGRLDRVVAHQHGDLTATVEAGITLREMNETLGAWSQWLPLDPPFADRASIGGLLATNDSGPCRHRFGTPRDMVIGVTLATPDGVLARAGGQVVKNVAGYDISRLVAGSFGSLAVIVSATFKLSPRPRATATVVIDIPDGTMLAAVVRAISSSQLEPAAFDVHVRRGAHRTDSRTRVLVRFASDGAVVEEQTRESVARAGALGVAGAIVRGDEEQHLWKGHSTALWTLPGAIVRVSWLPAALGAVLDAMERIGSGLRVEMIGRAGTGAGVIHIQGDIAQQLGAIEQLRQSKDLGNVVVMRATTELKSMVDVWPPQPNARLLESLKRALDPNGTLGAGRGVV
jgi:glycolate oxidase FAD binding subunit